MLNVTFRSGGSEGFDKKLQKTVAIKLMKPQRLALVKREAYILSMLAGKQRLAVQHTLFPEGGIGKIVENIGIPRISWFFGFSRGFRSRVGIPEASWTCGIDSGGVSAQTDPLAHCRGPSLPHSTPQYPTSVGALWANGCTSLWQSGHTMA